MDRRSRIEAALRRLLPRVPPAEAGLILDHAQDSKGLRAASPEAAAWLSAMAFIRHALTDYDQLLDEGYDLESARHFTLDAINEILAEWGARRRVGQEDGGQKDIDL